MPQFDFDTAISRPPKPPQQRRAARGWPPARRRAQAERIRRICPWLHATGPRTENGKRRARYNACKHNMRSAAMAALRQALRRQRAWLEAFTVLSRRHFAQERRRIKQKATIRTSNALDRLASALYLGETDS
jgi:hypothetical protein